MSNLRLHGLCKDFGTLRVLHDIDFEVEPGEFVALVGPSGCGKSTLLAIIAGLEDTTEGEIELDGRVVNELSPKDRNIAMVFQNYALYPTMSVRENLTFGLSIRRVPKDEQARTVQRVAELLDIVPLLDRKPSQLSGGQRQRVAMGRALVRDPSLFLFDEPLSNLDAKLRVRMRSEIKKLHQRLGITTVYVTHDQTEAMTLSTRIAVMNGGRVQQFATPSEIYSRPANVFVASFIGSVPMNVLPARLEAGPGGGAAALALPQEGGEARLPVTLSGPGRASPPRDCLFGIRAERIEIVPEPGAGDLAAVVDLLEPLGPETVVTLRLGGETVVTSVPAERVLNVDQRVGLRFAARGACLFDRENEARLDIDLAAPEAAEPAPEMAVRRG